MTSPAAPHRTRRDTTAAVHPPTAGARRLPPLALLHSIGRVAFWFAQQFCTAIARLIHSMSDIQAEVVEPQHLRSYVHIALCVNCDGPRMFDKNGYCETCCADAAFHRPGYKRGVFNVTTTRRRLVSVQRRPQTATALRRVQGR